MVKFTTLFSELLLWTILKNKKSFRGISRKLLPSKDGANLMVVADLIGDTVEQVMKTYGHLYQEDKLNIIAKIK